MKRLIVIWSVVFTLAFGFAFGSLVFEKVGWRIADKVTKGLLSAQSELLRHKMRNFGQYVYHLEIMIGEIDKMTWEDYKSKELRRLILEYKVVRQVDKLVKSYVEGCE